MVHLGELFVIDGCVRGCVIAEGHSIDSTILLSMVIDT